MPRTRVRPDPALSTPLATPARPLLALVPASGRHDYYAQRQAFLRSYTLSARESLGERLRRRWREIVDGGREALWNAVGWVFDEFSKRKRAILSALRWRMHRVGCFGSRQRRPEILIRNFF
ncbi:hypothetical protein MA16_Dca008091 [Dendrobium catenatum]|uniref:Uncharacterized protein n=1 Tax=Dendrobium catenatum TaxID=906689 RepID=A0A2I0WCY6_9ASPA|nr:hypothetical protein MA16_Dca008091 [Dendrobium catenatum]